MQFFKLNLVVTGVWFVFQCFNGYIPLLLVRPALQRWPLLWFHLFKTLQLFFSSLLLLLLFLVELLQLLFQNIWIKLCKFKLQLSLCLLLLLTREINFQADNQGLLLGQSFLKIDIQAGKMLNLLQVATCFGFPVACSLLL